MELLEPRLPNAFRSQVRQGVFRFAPPEPPSSSYSVILRAFCCTKIGSKRMEALIERAREDDAAVFMIMDSMSGSLPSYILHPNASRFVMRCFECFTNEQNKGVFCFIVDNFVAISEDKVGCRVVQKALHHADGPYRGLLLDELVQNAPRLSFHEYGNFVVQKPMDRGGDPAVTSNIVETLEGMFADLCTTAAGSYVVEKCLKKGSLFDRHKIIAEIFGNARFRQILADASGNFVVQTALYIAEHGVYVEMVKIIDRYKTALQTDMYGNKILKKIKEIDRRHERLKKSFHHNQ